MRGKHLLIDHCAQERSCIGNERAKQGGGCSAIKLCCSRRQGWRDNVTHHQRRVEEKIILLLGGAAVWREASCLQADVVPRLVALRKDTHKKEFRTKANIQRDTNCFWLMALFVFFLRLN